MLKGSIDLLDQNELRGWAQDEASPDTTVSLVISVNDREVGRTRARLLRRDLQDAGIGNGQDAFEFKFEAALSPRTNHVIHVRSQEGLDIPASPTTLDAKAAAEAPGKIERVDRYTVAGWCQDGYRSDVPVSFIITDNDKLLGRVLANLHRADLAAAGIGSGRHAFEFISRTRCRPPRSMSSTSGASSTASICRAPRSPSSKRMLSTTTPRRRCPNFWRISTGRTKSTARSSFSPPS